MNSSLLIHYLLSNRHKRTVPFLLELDALIKGKKIVKRKKQYLLTSRGSSIAPQPFKFGVLEP